MASSCIAEREALLECLADSPCTAAGRPIKECMESDADCQLKRICLMECKRGQLDMRKRIKGNFVGNETSKAGLEEEPVREGGVER